MNIVTPVDIQKQIATTTSDACDVRPVESDQVAAPLSQKAKTTTAIMSFANTLCAGISASNSPDKSFSISPISIVAALGMCLHIIRPEMKRQFIEKIGLPGLGEDEVHAAIVEVLNTTALPKEFKDGTIDIANGLACKDLSSIDPSLVNLVRETYGADIIAAPDLMDKVNSWVDEKTHNKIPKLLSDNNAALVLLNAVYLNLSWKEKFEKPSGGWEVGTFGFADGTSAPVSYMEQETEASLYEGEKFSLLEKKYLSPDGRVLSQVIFLPKEPQGLAALEATLTAETIKHYRQKARVFSDILLKLPKTKAESELHLLELLKEMGVPLDAVDSRIVGPGREISDVVHKTYVATNEEGTEAAAVTGIIVLTSIKTQKSFDVTHSYTYMIFDGDTLLFRGRVSDKDPLVVDAN